MDHKKLRRYDNHTYTNSRPSLAVVNGHFAAQKSKGLARMYSRPREGLLQGLVEQFQPQGKLVKLVPTEKPRARTMGEHISDALTRSTKKTPGVISGAANTTPTRPTPGGGLDDLLTLASAAKEEKRKKRESLNQKTSLTLSGKYDGNKDKVDHV